MRNVVSSREDCAAADHARDHRTRSATTRGEKRRSPLGSLLGRFGLPSLSVGWQRERSGSGVGLLRRGSGRRRAESARMRGGLRRAATCGVERRPRRDVRCVGRQCARRAAFGKGPENGRPGSVVNRGRAISIQIPRNLHGGVRDDADLLRKLPPGRQRWRAARPKPPLGRLARRADNGRPCAAPVRAVRGEGARG
jgi:hypothetical protein